MQTRPSHTQAVAEHELDRALSELDAIDLELRDLELIDVGLHDLEPMWQGTGPKIGARTSDARVMRVSSSYFAPAQFPGETDWWAKQLGGR